MNEKEREALLNLAIDRAKQLISITTELRKFKDKGKTSNYSGTWSPTYQRQLDKYSEELETLKGAFRALGAEPPTRPF